MTNEEKAKEYSQIQIADTVTERRIKEAYLNACEWKDKQFKEHLERKKRSYDIYSDYQHKYCSDAINEIINELFTATEQSKED